MKFNLALIKFSIGTALVIPSEARDNERKCSHLGDPEGVGHPELQRGIPPTVCTAKALQLGASSPSVRGSNDRNVDFPTSIVAIAAPCGSILAVPVPGDDEGSSNGVIPKHSRSDFWPHFGATTTLIAKCECHELTGVGMLGEVVVVGEDFSGVFSFNTISSFKAPG